MSDPPPSETTVKGRRKRMRPEETGLHRVGYLALLRNNRPIRNLIFANFVSGVGDWFNWIAVLIVLTRTSGSYNVLGAIVILHTGLPVLLAPLAGFAADRYDRRALLVFCDFLRVGVVLGLVVASHLDSTVLIWALVFVQYSVAAFYVPAGEALIPRLAEGAELKTANALYVTAITGAAALGSALGGATEAAVGADAAFVVDALTFVTSGLLVLRIVVPPPRVEPAGREPVSGTTTTGVWGQVRREPRLGASFLAVVSISIPAGLLWLAVVALGQHVTPLGADGAISIGILNAATFIGGMIGSMAFNDWFAGTTDLDHARGCRRLVAMRFAALLAIAALPAVIGVVGLRVGFGLAIIVLGCFSLPGGALWVAASSFAQTYAPDGLRGRVFAILNALWTGGQALSILLATRAVDAGASLATVCLVIAGIMALLAAVWTIYIARWPAWSQRA